MPVSSVRPLAAPLESLGAVLGECSVSGLSSGAFMTVQLHLAHSSLFCGAGVIAGGPYRCAESFRGASPLPADAWVQNALFICMNPLTPEVGPQPERLLQKARDAAASGQIDPLDGMAKQRLYLFTGTEDQVVNQTVVRATKAFYEGLGIAGPALQFVDWEPAGHAIMTTRLEDNPLGTNAPPYINRWNYPEMQSWRILSHLHGPLKPPAARAAGELLRFDQREFFGDQPRASMSAYGYLYVPPSVRAGGPCKVHVVLHGCKQGANYVDLVNGRPDRANDAPYGDRYITTTGYNEIADTNGFVILYPQAEGIDNGFVQNPEGCWDWWGYSDPEQLQPDYWSKNAIQIEAIHTMLRRLAQPRPPMLTVSAAAEVPAAQPLPA